MPYYSHGPHSFLLAEEFSAWNQAHFFNNFYWQQCGYLTNIARGRGCTWFFSWQQQDFVLRHYHRGGKLAPLLNDRFLYLGLNQTRPWQEWNLLYLLYQQGLPVPKPIGAHVARQACWYQADIIMQRIPDSKTLAERLSQKPLDEVIWHRLGTTIAEFHQLGVYHSDLNAHNILIDDEDKLWLIDFDKSGLKSAKKAWQQQNIQRLKRSLDKLQDQGKIKPLQKNDWPTFLSVYQNNL